MLTSPLFSAVTGLVIGLLLGVLVTWLLLIRHRFGAGFAALGMAAGLFLGLNSSPIMGTLITSVFTLLGVLIPHLPPKWMDPPPPNPPHSKPPPPAVGEWLFPFAAALAVGTLFGIAVRINDSLNFISPNLKNYYKSLGYDDKQVAAIIDRQTKRLAGQLPNLSEQYKALGFTDAQVKAIMERQAKTILLDPSGDKPPPLPESVPVTKGPYLQDFVKHGVDYRMILNSLAGHNPEEALANLKRQAKDEMRERIAQLESQKEIKEMKDPKAKAQAILDTIKSDLSVGR